MLTVRTTLLGIVLCLCTRTTRAQWRDYIVTMHNDTIYGGLQFRLSAPVSLLTRDSSYRVDIRTIDSWFSANRKILERRILIPGKTKYVFLPVLEDGAITLYVDYASPNVNGKTTICYYAQKGDAPPVEIWTNRGFARDNRTQRQAMATLIADNPTVKQTFDTDTKYEAMDAEYYIHEYNRTP
jgi:hypothetical protein